MFKLKAYYFFWLLPLLMALTVFTTTLKTDISTFFVAGDNAEEILLASEVQSGSLSRRYILSIGSSQQAAKSTFVSAFITALKKIEGVNDVWQAGEIKGAVNALSLVYREHGTQLFSRYPETDLANLFIAENLNARAKGLKEALLSPQSRFIKKIAKKDPLLLSLTGFKSISAKLQAAAQNESNYQNFILETAMSGIDFEHQLRIQQQIRQVFSAQQQKFNTSLELEVTGVPMFAVETQSRMQADITFISIVSSVALSLLFFVLFKSFRVLFWVACLLITVVCSAVLVTGFIFGFVHGMTMAIGTTLVGICIDYPIHALVHGQATVEEHRIQAVKTIFPSMLMGGITTLIGYFALGLSGYPGFQQVAVYAGTGILVSLILTRYFLPRLMTGSILGETKIKSVALWLTFCQRLRLPLLTLLILASLGSVYVLEGLTWMQDLRELTPELDELKKIDQRIRSRMVSMEPGRFVLVSADNLETALQHSEKVYKTLDILKSKGDLNDYFGLYPWLLSKQQQQQNSEAFHAALTEKNLDLWQQALLEHGLSVAHLGNLKYESNAFLEPQAVLQTALGRLLQNQLIISDNRVLVIIWLSEHKAEALEKVFAEDDTAHYFSQRDMLNRMAVDYQKRAEIMLLAGLAFIALLLIVRYKSLLKALQTLAPACLSALIILALWSLNGVAISFLHLVGFLLVAAICVDYGIFYQENRGGNILLTYQAMAASMLTSALAFGCLIVADTSTLKILAQVVAGGVVLGFMFCPLLIKQKVG